MEISPEALKMLLASVRESTADLIEAIGVPSGRIALSPGEEVRGEVVEQRPSGSYLVKIAGAPFDMQLPSSTRVGTTVQLTYVTDQPRLTFALSTSGSRESQVTLSSAGRWLGATAGAIQTPQEQPLPASISSARLFDRLPADTQAIARRLQETITRSGLFYESHLARWSQGEYPQELLLQEPQGKLSPQLPGNTPGMQLPADQPSVQQPMQTRQIQTGDRTAAGAESGTAEQPQRIQTTAPQLYPESPDPVEAGPAPEQGRTTVGTPGSTAEMPSPVPQQAADEGAENLPLQAQNTPAASLPRPAQAPSPAPAATVPETPLQQTHSPAPQPTSEAKPPIDSPGQGMSRQSAPVAPSAQPLIEPAGQDKQKTVDSRPDEPARSLPPHSSPADSADRQVSRPVTQAPVQQAQSLNAATEGIADRISRTDDSPAGRSAQATAAAAQSPGEPHDNRTMPLVKEQLATLNSGQLVWQGEAWKGQQMEWKITREQKQRGHAVARSWATDLSMELPELGTVTARIRLTGNQIHLSLNGEREETLQRMRQGTGKLQEALEGAGMQLARVEVERVEPPAD